jgi:tripartite-type tricarboxylate transporter receptor subunit TctC
MIQRLWSEQKNMTFTTSVVTRPGGGGTILWSYMNQRRGDAHHLANSYVGAADLRKYLDRQYGEVRQVLTDLGMAKAPAK